MSDQSSPQIERTCTHCGHRGWEAVCPHDGHAMIALESNENRAIAQGDDTAALLRGDDFGEWKAPELPPTMESLIGQVIDDRFEMQDILGQGGMGTVYKAYQPAVKRTVAIKVMRREFSENADIMRRFHREALAASRLNHPNIISIYDFGQTDEVVYIAMEHLRGRTLGDAIGDEAPMNPQRVIHIVLQVARSLHEAKTANIVHRDLKPENIFLIEVEDDPDFVKVLDFGVAKLRTPGSDTTVTQAGTLFGTPKYMAPEQTQNHELDHRADIYSLGIIMYEMLMGTAPFEGENPLAVLLSHASEPAPRFSEKRPDLSVDPRIEGVVFKAIAKERDERYADATTFIEELEKLAVILAGTPMTHEFPLVESLAAMDRAPLEGNPGATRNPWALRFGLGIVLGALLLFMTFVNRQTDAVPEPAPAPVGQVEAIKAPVEPVKKAEPVRTIQIQSKPSGARLTHKKTGADLGLTPVSLPLDEETTYRLKLGGFETESIVVGPTFEGDTLTVSLNRIAVPTPSPSTSPKTRPNPETRRLRLEKVPRALEPVEEKPVIEDEEIPDELE